MRSLPFMEIPILLAGPPEKENSDKEVMAKIYPEMIAGLYPAYYGGTVLFFIGGIQLISPAEITEIENHIARYWQHVDKIENKELTLKKLSIS